MKCDDPNNLSDENKRKAKEWYDGVKDMKSSQMTAPLGTGTKPEPEQDVIMRQFEKCWHGVFDHLDKMLLIQITDVFRSGYKSGYTSRNAEIEALKAEIKSMRCCGNCGQEELPKEDKTCNSCKRGVEWSDDDNWTRKNNPKNSTPQ